MATRQAGADTSSSGRRPSRVEFDDITPAPRDDLAGGLPIENVAQPGAESGSTRGDSGRGLPFGAEACPARLSHLASSS